MNQQNSEYNKPMTVEEKNQLGNNIRSLNKEQLKGIIRILSENNSVPKSKYFEFDIDKLSTKKLRELEKYVKECLTYNNNTKNISNNNNTHAQNTNNNKTTNQKENQNNKNSNNKANITQASNQNSLLKSNNKEINKTQQDNKESTSAKKLKQNNKKNEKNNESFSESESISSDSSLSN